MLHMTVKIYIRTTEPWSHTLVQYLNSRHIPYSSYDVSVDRQAHQEMIAKTGQKRVPVIEVDGQVLVGFNPYLIDELLSEETSEI